MTYNRRITKRGTQLPQASAGIEADEATHEQSGGSLERATITVASLDAAQVSGYITKTQSKATYNVSSSHGTEIGEGIPRRQETMGAQVLKLGLGLSITFPMMHHSGEVTHSEVLRVVWN